MTIESELYATRRERALTVQALIDCLATVEDKTLPIEVEGCDCRGLAAHAELDSDGSEVDGPCVYIRRLDQVDHERTEGLP